MNKISILFVFIISSFCFGQNFNAGTILGINTSQVSFDNLSGFNKIGIRGGAFINKQFHSFEGQIELLYINKGSREKIDQEMYSEGYRLYINYLEIPISFKKEIYKKTKLESGMGISFLLDWTEKYDGFDFPNYGFEMKKIEYSAHIGLEYEIRKNIYFNIRLSNSILPIRSHSLDPIYKWYHGQYNTSISFVVYYYFLKK